MNRSTHVRESFWFVPALLCALAVVLAETLIVVDRRIGPFDLGPLSVLINTVGAGGSRDLLGAIAGSVLTVAATSFSITLAVLATASATYGPRLVRNFIVDRFNQLVLGVYVATFLYSLLVLRSIREIDEGTDTVFVPHLAVNMAVLLAVLSIGVLVFFINHISNSVQVWTLAAQVRADFTKVVDGLYPDEMGRSPAEVADGRGRDDVPDRLATDGVPVPAPRTGYVQSIDEDDLLAIAQTHDLVVSLCIRPGGHVIEGEPVAMVWPPDRVGEDLIGQVHKNVVIGNARSPRQDVEFTVLVLEEMAVRALSPSTNDPYTARNALDDLAAGLVRLARRSPPSPYRYCDSGRLRVVAPRVVLEDLLDHVFDAMRRYAIEHPSVLARTLELAQQVGAASPRTAIRARLSTHVELLVEAFERSSPQQVDLLRLRSQAAEVGRALATALRRGTDERADAADGSRSHRPASEAGTG